MNVNLNRSGNYKANGWSGAIVFSRRQIESVCYFDASAVTGYDAQRLHWTSHDYNDHMRGRKIPSPFAYLGRNRLTIQVI